MPIRVNEPKPLPPMLALLSKLIQGNHIRVVHKGEDVVKIAMDAEGKRQLDRAHPEPKLHIGNQVVLPESSKDEQRYHYAIDFDSLRSDLHIRKTELADVLRLAPEKRTRLDTDENWQKRVGGRKKSSHDDGRATRTKPGGRGGRD
jgi:hypothetical protein